MRAAHHLRRLTGASCGNRLANKWSAHLASTHSFYHRSMVRLLRVCHARYAGETLGMGMSHHSRRIGVGATPNSNGQWVVAANFLRL